MDWTAMDGTDMQWRLFRGPVIWVESERALALGRGNGAGARDGE